MWKQNFALIIFRVVVIHHFVNSLQAFTRHHRSVVINRERTTPAAFVYRAQMEVGRVNGEQQQPHVMEDDENVFHTTATTDTTRTTLKKPGPFLTPYQILYPEAFPATDDNGYDRQLGLEGTLQLIIKAVERLANEEEAAKILRNLPPSQQQILRMEHQIAIPVDPLAWLHAQRATANEEQAAFYLANQEGTMEVACLGAAQVIRNTGEIWITPLPENAQWYGGERFDSNRNLNWVEPPAGTAEGWRAFGDAYWMLPAVELRQTDKKRGGGTTLAIHLSRKTFASWSQAAQAALPLLRRLSDRCSPRVAPTTLPPVITRDSSYGPGQDGPEIYEQAVEKALQALSHSHENDDDGATEQKKQPSLQKVVLARMQRMHLGATVTALDVIRRWKYGGHEGGHLFYLRPAGEAPEFFGCTPERLFQINGVTVRSEALAGTRPRGLTQAADEALLQELFASSKDQRENQLTGNYIEEAFGDLARLGWIVNNQTSVGEFFVRRLLHLQHICRLYAAPIVAGRAMDVARQLLTKLHPTPAVCGIPLRQAKDFIRNHEGFDRGFYAAPIGYVGHDSADLLVGIRSGLVTTTGGVSTVAMYAGAGLVPGSNFQDEWAEINLKFGVVSSLFPPSPFTLQSAPTANVAWAASFVEELIRNGVTHFYVCPGSRSTPLVVAIARAARTHVGVVHAISVHDERAAGFRALGYGRASGRPAAVITSSGTAVANLGPSIVEASQDGVPLLILTADRPYESRDTGANQAIDQVKIFSQTYVRWFRDVLPPSDDVPVSVALSDANHAVAVSRQMRGPVHINIQFRENLAPEAGPIRSDERVDSVTKYNGARFADAAAFRRWSIGGMPWKRMYSLQGAQPSKESVVEIASLIEQSRRGMIVVGNLRLPSSPAFMEDQITLSKLISDFAQDIGFPIFAGAQSGSLRFCSPAVVPFAEHLLKSPSVSDNLKPDLIIQIGAPLVSTQIPSLIKSSLKNNDGLNHVLIHPTSGAERTDPDFTVSHQVTSEIGPYIKALAQALRERGTSETCHSELAPMVTLGRQIQTEMKNIILEASRSVAVDGSHSALTEPEITLALSEVVLESDEELALFISNSMPVRDAEFFFYPFTSSDSGYKNCPKAIGTNRGASGIDGIISSALGFSEATGARTTLLIGDLSALHDLNSMHSLSRDFDMLSQTPSNKRHPLTTVIVNNNGGGIFSFLPVAKYGADVAFEEFFGTPTNAFSFAKGAEAFGLPHTLVTSYSAFLDVYRKNLASRGDVVIEASVVSRDVNVAIHRQISEKVDLLVTDLLNHNVNTEYSERLPITVYGEGDLNHEKKTMILLHGWMGDKSDWDRAGSLLAGQFASDWNVVSVDLPGHSLCSHTHGPEISSVKQMLAPLEDERKHPLHIQSIANSVLKSLKDDYAITRVDSVVGYSLGGRVALEMKRQSEHSEEANQKSLLTHEAAMILIGSYPGDLENKATTLLGTRELVEPLRCEQDDRIAARLKSLSNKICLLSPTSAESRILWNHFLKSWYDSPIWGSLKDNQTSYAPLLLKRAKSLSRRGRDLAAIISQCSPPRNNKDNWSLCLPSQTLFLAGELDSKYSRLGKLWAVKAGINYFEIENAGHALLVESPNEVVKIVVDFMERRTSFARPEFMVNMRKFMDAEKSMDFSSASSEAKPSAKFDASAASGTPSFDTFVAAVDFETFSINLMDSTRDDRAVVGIGWGDSAAVARTVPKREGLIIQLDSQVSGLAGLGEVSPLAGLHSEGLDDALDQILSLRAGLETRPTAVSFGFDSKELLALDGGLTKAVDSLAQSSGIKKLFPSVRFGLEMALLSLAAQQRSMPLHSALQKHTKLARGSKGSGSLLPLNGLLSRGSGGVRESRFTLQSFPSLKVKIGYQSEDLNKAAILKAVRQMELSGKPAKIRADANRAWSASQAAAFSSSLQALDVNVSNQIEYVEEPLQKQLTEDGRWSLENQVRFLESWFQSTNIPYALDESIADLAHMLQGDFELIQEEIRSVFANGSRGCACFVLKPALLGMELSMRIARFSRSELGMGAVFSSSFDSGLGLANTAFLASLSDDVESTSPTYSHGLGTYVMLQGDTLTPPFASYINKDGMLNLPSLSRALFGLKLDDLRDALYSRPLQTFDATSEVAKQMSFVGTATTNGNGKEINVLASLPLPFSAKIASAKFTDLPQQSRWSPWISSVAYQGTETEWTLNVRGIPLKWRATSRILDDPWPGIEWQSVSGIKNCGAVEFVPDSSNSCHMNVRMVIVPPKLLSPLFQGTSAFLEDFVRDKLLKWSLEMFRDVVKADLALERGDVELGDALFEAVEGKASAIEATLVNLPPVPKETE